MIEPVIDTRQEILRQAIELRRKQDTRLAGQQRRSAILGGAAITVGALISAVVASPTADATSGQVVATGVFAILLALANGVCWYGVYAAAAEWLDGPDINKLTDNYSNRNDGHRALLDHLIAVHNDHRTRNEPAVNSARRLVTIQVIATFVAASLLSRSSTRARVNPCWPTRPPNRTNRTTS